MRLILLPFFLLLLSLPAQAQEWTGIDCGTYEVKGVVRSSKNVLLVVVNEKTKSEILITVPIPNEALLAPYIDKPMLAKLVVNSKTSGPHILGTIQDIQARVPNPIANRDTGMHLIAKTECKK
jgi:hypothetical protein